MWLSFLKYWHLIPRNAWYVWRNIHRSDCQEGFPKWKGRFIRLLFVIRERNSFLISMTHLSGTSIGYFRRSSEIHVVSQSEHHTIISVNFATWREWPIDVSFYPEMTGKPKWCTSQSESAFPLFPWTYIFILRRRGSLGWDLQIHLQSTPHVGINVVPLKDVRCFNWEFRKSQSKFSCNLAANSRPN